jgi:hypothetical protein
MYHGPWRDHFRLTSAHNTVMIDGRDQALPMPNFNWRQIPEAKCIAWTGKRVTGALTYSGPVEFTRELTHPRPGVWDLVDQFVGDGAHEIECFFHFAPGLELDLQEDRHTLTVLKDGQPFVIVHIPTEGLRPQLSDAWYSDQYGVKQRNRGLVARWEGELQGNAASFRWAFRLIQE